MYNTNAKPWGFRLRSSSTFIIVVVCLGLFTVSTDHGRWRNMTDACVTIGNVDFLYRKIIPILPPALINRVNIPESQVQYYISILLASYAVTFFICAPIFGYLADRLGSRRQPFLYGLLANIVSLILFMKAKSFVGMTIARTLQGISSAAVNVVGMALIKDTVSKEKLGAGMAYSNAAIQCGLVLGPSIGGFLYDHLGYEAVFILPAVLLGIDFFMRLILIEKAASDNNQSSSEALEEERETQQTSSNITSTEESPLLGPQESHEGGTRRLPVLDLILRGRMATTLFVQILDVMMWTGLESTIPLFVLRTFEWKASQAGLLFFATCFPGILLSPLAGKAIDRLGSLPLSAVGVTVSAVCYITQRIVRANTLHDKVVFVTLFTLSNISGLFLAISMGAEIGLIAHDVDVEREKAGKKVGMVGKGFALSMMACSGGQFLGPLMGGFMIEKTGWAGLTTLYGALWIAALLAILSYTEGGLAVYLKKEANKQDEHEDARVE